MIVSVRDGLPAGQEVLSARQGTVFALSCPGRTGCIALANEYGKTGQSAVYLIRLEPSGHVVSTHLVASGRRRQLAALSCTLITRCWIAGTFVLSNTKAPPLVAAWNGSRLTLKTIPVTGSPATWEPKGISCSPTTCEIVGVVLGRGTAFAVQTRGVQPLAVKTTAEQMELTDVVCTSADRCVASGDSGARGNEGFISAIDSGSLGPAEYGSGVSAMALGALACHSTTCWATGDVVDAKAYGGIAGAIYPVVSGSPTTAIVAPQTYSLPAISTMGNVVIAAVNTLNRDRCGVAVLG